MRTEEILTEYSSCTYAGVLANTFNEAEWMLREIQRARMHDFSAINTRYQYCRTSAPA